MGGVGSRWGLGGWGGRGSRWLHTCKIRYSHPLEGTLKLSSLDHILFQKYECTV